MEDRVELSHNQPASNGGLHVEDTYEQTREEVAQRIDSKAAADIALAAVDELAEKATELEEATVELDKLKAEVAALQDQVRRQAAEFQNYRRRTEQEKKVLVEIGKNAVIEQVLDVGDDFHRSLQAAAQMEQKAQGGPAYTSLKQGVDLVYRKFWEVFGKLGVVAIEAVGQPFNEHEHEALMQQPAPEGVAAGIVLQEFQRGYKRGDRVLRHSKVIVSS